jgi:hypothetical protein
VRIERSFFLGEHHPSDWKGRLLYKARNTPLQEKGIFRKLVFKNFSFISLSSRDYVVNH